MPPLTLIAGSLMPEHSSLPLDCLPILMSVTRSSMAAYVSPSSNMEPPMSLLNVARGLPMHPSASTASGGLSTKTVTRLSHLSPVIDHLQRKALHQLAKMDAEKRNSVLLHESAISIYNCGLPLYLQLWSRSPAHCIKIKSSARVHVTILYLNCFWAEFRP